MTRIGVLLGEAHSTPPDVSGRVVVVIDVLRAASTVAHAIANGASAVFPCESVDEATRHAAEMDRKGIRLAGERRMLRIDGFDFGNSPLEFTQEAIGGRALLCTTTNGTPALVATHGARACFFGAFVNASATIAAVLRELAAAPADVLIVCAGHEGRVTLEDVVCAGRIVRSLVDALPPSSAHITDGAHIACQIESPYQRSLDALATDAAHARALRDAGFSADVDFCLALDTVPVAVAYRQQRLERH